MAGRPDEDAGNNAGGWSVTARSGRSMGRFGLRIGQARWAC